MADLRKKRVHMSELIQPKCMLCSTDKLFGLFLQLNSVLICKRE